MIRTISPWPEPNMPTQANQYRGNQEGCMKKTPDVEVFEQAVQEAKEKKYLLRLYVAGTTPRSTQAIMNIKKICEEHLSGRYDLEVVDIYQQPLLAKDEQVIAAPTLIKKLPLPLRRFIGSMADVERILVGFDVKSVEEPPPKKKGTMAPRTGV
jgi:circadian clock protein KaiB